MLKSIDCDNKVLGQKKVANSMTKAVIYIIIPKGYTPLLLKQRRSWPSTTVRKLFFFLLNYFYAFSFRKKVSTLILLIQVKWWRRKRFDFSVLFSCFYFMHTPVDQFFLYPKKTHCLKSCSSFLDVNEGRKAKHRLNPGECVIFTNSCSHC